MLMILVLVGTVAAGGGEDRAGEIVTLMREALRSSAKAETVRSLSMQAELRRVTPVEGEEARDLSGQVTVDMLLPDRYLKVETLSPMPGGPEISVGTGLDGQEAWQAPMGVPPGHRVVIRVQTPNEPGGAGMLRRRTRAELTRLALVALGAAPEDTALSFKYAGEAEAPEGRAHVLEVTGADDFSARLFVDVKTHMPLLMSFKGRLPRMRTVRASGPADMARARAQADRASQAVAEEPETEIRLFVSDYREVQGVLLPHRFLREVESGLREEWTVKKWKVNPQFKADAFRKQS